MVRSHISWLGYLSLSIITLLVHTSSKGKISSNPLKNKTPYFQMGLRLIEDRSFNPEYDFATLGCINTVTIP